MRLSLPTHLDGAAALLRQSRHVTVLTGPGVSAESGIPTFRDALSGLWSHFDPMDLAIPGAFERDPALVWGWYEWRRMQVLRAMPNPAHLALAQLARQVERLTLVTQNVDDLHERAGSRDMVHLHGSMSAPRCLDCAAPFAFAADAPTEPEGGRHPEPPRCVACGGAIRPGVVWFDELLPRQGWAAAEQAARTCDDFVSIGASGLIYPVAGVVHLAAVQGARIVVVNPADGPGARCNLRSGDLRLAGPAGAILPELVARLVD
jgi:NAD-dependent deacetylase